jgi:hypothetical protein
MTEDELHQQIGETLMHMLPKGASFILLYRLGDQPSRTLSTVPPEHLAEIFEEQVEMLRAGRIRGLTRHEAWERD